jgi:hypothetical protein
MTKDGAIVPKDMRATLYLTFLMDAKVQPFAALLRYLQLGNLVVTWNFSFFLFEVLRLQLYSHYRKLVFLIYIKSLCYSRIFFLHISDINECLQPDVYPCLHGTCINTPGTYQCSTRKSIMSLPGTKLYIQLAHL